MILHVDQNGLILNLTEIINVLYVSSVNWVMLYAFVILLLWDVLSWRRIWHVICVSSLTILSVWFYRQDNSLCHPYLHAVLGFATKFWVLIVLKYFVGLFVQILLGICQGGLVCSLLALAGVIGTRYRILALSLVSLVIGQTIFFFCCFYMDTWESLQICIPFTVLKTVLNRFSCHVFCWWGKNFQWSLSK